MNEIFEKYTDLIACIGIREGKAYLDTCDERMVITEVMVLLNKFTQEYLEAIANQSNQKENENG